MKRGYQDPSEVRYFTSLIYGNEGREERELVINALGPFCGGVLEVTEEEDFSLHTDYYREEMGGELVRCYVSFRPIASRDHLVHLKWFAKRLETQTRKKEGRTINIDPGFIALEQVVLASAKGFPHKVYLKDGIYADVILVRRRGDYQALPWTFRDYAEPQVTAWFNQQRSKLFEELRLQNKLVRSDKEI